MCIDSNLTPERRDSKGGERDDEVSESESNASILTRFEEGVIHDQHVSRHPLNIKGTK